MKQKSEPNLQELLSQRYSDAPAIDDKIASNALLQSMASRGSCRSFQNTPVPSEILQTLCAVALASPTKSDLQQRDIILLQSQEVREQLSSFVAGQAWVSQAPMIVIFCGNNRRQRLLHEWHDVEFANDHLDAFFNATADAAIAMGSFVTAAEALGLGCCPISAVRNEAQKVSELLGLPAHVFPFAGLAIGYPDGEPKISKRLPMAVTCHVDQYNEDNLKSAIETYDTERAAAQPYSQQRFTQKFGTVKNYAWSDDKVRQYSEEERAGFGAYIRAQGFKLD